jgi:hypothetical protein
MTRLRRFLAEAWLRLAELIGLEPETVFDTATNPPAPPEKAFKPCLKPCRLEQQPWEDKEGGKRLTVALIADEVGPSLRWATAEVQKAERSDKAAGQQSKPAGNPFGYDPSLEPF